jgi:hypothetical protein
MIYLVPNKHGYAVQVKFANRTYHLAQRKQRAAALLVIAELQRTFPDVKVAVITDFSA